MTVERKTLISAYLNQEEGMLTPREELVIQMLFNIDGTNRMTVAELQKTGVIKSIDKIKHPVGKARIHQIRAKACRKLSHPLRMGALFIGQPTQ